MVTATPFYYAISYHQYTYIENTAIQGRLPQKAVGHRERSASKRLFSSNTASKSSGRRQPCRCFFPCLAEKISLFEVLSRFAAKIFSCNELRERSNTWCIARARRKLRGKRWLQNRINPYGQPPNGGVFSYCWVNSSSRAVQPSNTSA